MQTRLIREHTPEALPSPDICTQRWLPGGSCAFLVPGKCAAELLDLREPILAELINGPGASRRALPSHWTGMLAPNA